MLYNLIPYISSTKRWRRYRQIGDMSRTRRVPVMKSISVSVFVPGSTVPSMQDEIQDGKVTAAVEAAKKAYMSFDSDGQIPVIEYTEDFDNAVAEALAYADKTPGVDLIVIVTNFVCDQPRRADSLLAELKDDFVVLVPVSNKGYNETWANMLDNASPAADKIDVITVDGLSDPSIARDEVGPWANA